MGFVDCLHCKLDVPCSILLTMLLYWFLVLFCINMIRIKSRKQLCLIVLRYLILHLAVFLTIIVLHSWTITHRIFPYPTPSPNQITTMTAITTPRPQVLNTVQQQHVNIYILMNRDGTSITLELATSGIQTETQKYNVEPLDPQTILEVSWMSSVSIFCSSMMNVPTSTPKISNI